MSGLLIMYYSNSSTRYTGAACKVGWGGGTHKNTAKAQQATEVGKQKTKEKYFQNNWMTWNFQWLQVDFNFSLATGQIVEQAQRSGVEYFPLGIDKH